MEHTQTESLLSKLAHTLVFESSGLFYEDKGGKVYVIRAHKNFNRLDAIAQTISIGSNGYRCLDVFPMGNGEEFAHDYHFEQGQTIGILVAKDAEDAGSL